MCPHRRWLLVIDVMVVTSCVCQPQAFSFPVGQLLSPGWVLRPQTSAFPSCAHSRLAEAVCQHLYQTGSSSCGSWRNIFAEESILLLTNQKSVGNEAKVYNSRMPQVSFKSEVWETRAGCDVCSVCPWGVLCVWCMYTGYMCCAVCVGYLLLLQ